MTDWTGNHAEKLKAIEVEQYLLENQHFVTRTYHGSFS